MSRPTRALVAWSAAVAVLLGVAWWIVTAGRERQGTVLNPLEEPVTARFGSLEVEVGAGGRAAARVPTGGLDVEVRGKDGRLVDRHVLHLPASGKGQAVYSVLGAAPLYRANVIYAASRERAGSGADDAMSGFSALLGERLREVQADYVLRPPPSQIEVSQSSRRTVKTQIDVLPGGWRQALFLAADDPRGAQTASALARRLRRALPGEWHPLALAIQTAGLSGHDFWAAISGPRALAAYRLSFGASFGSFLAAGSFLASSHGFWSSTYLFARSISCQTVFNASSGWNPSTAA